MFIAPFFILGNPRSGTSLFRLMLNSHPRIIVPPECGFLQWWHAKYGDWKSINSDNKIDIDNYVKNLLNSRKIEGWNLNKQVLVKEIKRKKPMNYGELSSIVYYCFNKSKSDEAIIGDKNNYYIHHLKLLSSIYPQTKYIHIVRDGRDVACSYRKNRSLNTTSDFKPKLAYNIEEIADEWKNNISKISSFLKDKSHLIVHYEDLITNSKKTLMGVCEFLNTSFESEMLEYYRSELMDEPISTLDWKKKLLEPVDKNNTQKYLSLLKKDEIKSFNKICEKTLLEFGYNKHLDVNNL